MPIPPTKPPPSRLKPRRPASRNTVLDASSAPTYGGAPVAHGDSPLNVEKVRAPCLLHAVLEQEQREAEAEAKEDACHASHQEVASTALHVAEGMKEENLAYGRYRFVAPPDPTDKKFVSRARSVRIELEKLPIYKEFARFSVREKGGRKPHGEKMSERANENE